MVWVIPASMNVQFLISWTVLLQESFLLRLLITHKLKRSEIASNRQHISIQFESRSNNDIRLRLCVKIEPTSKRTIFYLEIIPASNEPSPFYLKVDPAWNLLLFWLHLHPAWIRLSPIHLKIKPELKCPTILPSISQSTSHKLIIVNLSSIPTSTLQNFLLSNLLEEISYKFSIVGRLHWIC